MSRKYKIVIFGATGFTGELCARFMSERYSDIPIAIAGRSAEKLEKIKNTNNLPFPIIVADAFDVNSLEKMCRDTEVVLSTAGPYHKYGSDLLGACVKHDCHYVDITGESFWVKDMIEKHHKEAQNKGLRIINACGLTLHHQIWAYFMLSTRLLGMLIAFNVFRLGKVKLLEERWKQCFHRWMQS